MRKRRSTVLVTLAVVAMTALMLMTGCIRIITNSETITGSGELVTKEYDFANFTRIEVGDAFEVDITHADEFDVTIKMNENLFSYLDVSQSGSTLRVRMEPNFNYQQTTRQVSISMPALRSLELSGASRGEITGFETSNAVDLEVSGASSLEITGLVTGKAQFDISGASRIIGDITMTDGNFEVSGASTIGLDGEAADVILDVSGASTARLEDFPVDIARIDVSGASNVTVEVNDRLDVEISGASRLIYGGDAELGSIQVSGGSTLRRN